MSQINWEGNLAKKYMLTKKLFQENKKKRVPIDFCNMFAVNLQGKGCKD
jgi:hypothetical protein